MLYVFFGSDMSTVRERARERASQIANGGEVAHVIASDHRPGILREHAGSVSLFGSNTVTIIDTFSEDADAFDALIEDLPLLAESAHAFVVIESALGAGDKKTFQKHAAEYIEAAAEKKERFNLFALTDAFLERDKKSLWLLFTKAQQAGVSSEEIAGLLFWQVKTLRLVARVKNADEAELKPFVYTKAKRGLKRFKPEELERFSRELMTLYHDGHLGIRDMDLALERWVLSV
jgi:DNA polymerase III delta subunit